MKLKLTLITLAVLFFFGLTNTVKAQTTTTTYPASHLQAAERLLKESGLQENMQKMFTQVIDVQSQQLPEGKRGAFRDVMNKFIAKYITWEELKNAFVPIYASEYSETELNQIADFLSSPAGKAMTAKQPELMQKGAQWGMKIGKDHKADLEKMMKEEMGEK